MKEPKKEEAQLGCERQWHKDQKSCGLPINSAIQPLVGVNSYTDICCVQVWTHSPFYIMLPGMAHSIQSLSSSGNSLDYLPEFGV